MRREVDSDSFLTSYGEPTQNLIVCSCCVMPDGMRPETQRQHELAARVVACRSRYTPSLVANESRTSNLAYSCGMRRHSEHTPWGSRGQFVGNATLQPGSRHG